ncbi:hypothetical protein Rhe02_93680 [Rhizocola hellebori]|uniref:DUF899 domain-containing protein n=1 Tax=Rhizocola hellebori TaxID=1392758 RepID=A0A8J3QLM0_9ACTN|nr:DUF899 domain-containing protein [Rhizocola hellebori]GIH11301.1 hypothetical protein Rhe02_93680 [Rhizocola hellebori]
MNLPEIASREQWLTARKALLIREKEFTRTMDLLNADRRRLPMVRIDNDYVFEGARGETRLLDLFGDQPQLIIQHVMFGPEWERACPSCSAGLDELSPSLLDHLKARKTAFAGVSRAPYAKIAAELALTGWKFEWVSSFGSSFNFDFHVTLDNTVTPIWFNYRDEVELEQTDMAWLTKEQPTEHAGYSCFLRDGDTVFHTYSTYARGTEQTGGAYNYLDMTALGRQEDWEEPKDRSGTTRGAQPNFLS